jgi:hypothetical protein
MFRFTPECVLLMRERRRIHTRLRRSCLVHGIKALNFNKFLSSVSKSSPASGHGAKAHLVFHCLFKDSDDTPS